VAARGCPWPALEILIHTKWSSSPTPCNSDCDLDWNVTSTGAAMRSRCHPRRFESFPAEQGTPCQMLVVRVFSVLPAGAGCVSIRQTGLAVTEPRDDGLRFN